MPAELHVFEKNLGKISNKIKVIVKECGLFGTL